MNKVEYLSNSNEVLTKKLQQKNLEILLYYKNICEQYNLTFYLCGGGLIGAIRHAGFIPWDDDIDCFMPRKDYEKLYSLWSTIADIDKYKICRTNEYENYHDAGMSIRDCDTTLINKHSEQEDICHGVALEIMPIDGCPNSSIKRMIQLIEASLFALFNAQRLPDNKGKCIRVISQIMYKIVRSNKSRTKIWKWCEREMAQYNWDECEYVTELVGSVKGMLIKHPKERFEKIVYKDFEGHKIPVMEGYDEYLKLIFGDYMKLPPVDQRVAKHNAIIDLDTPYIKYKGILYCKEVNKNEV